MINILGDLLTRLALGGIERGLVPDRLTRAGVRRLCRARQAELRALVSADGDSTRSFARAMASGPVAPVPEMANEQHYELPPEFFGLVLGSHRKYSGCFWPAAASTLADAEEAALDITIERADLADGQRILELGCGWGSLTLRMAERFPAARITAVSNSAPQRRFIEQEAKRRGLVNLEIITADMNDFAPHGRFDRVVSVEMFEHMRNYEELLRRIAGWLEPDGALFVHVFCHRDTPYTFETDGAGNWMGRYFFTGGIMPSAGLLACFDRDLAVARQWTWDGTHYQRTADAWLENMDRHREEILPILARVYGARAAQRWFRRWRLFFIACAELFGLDEGRVWQVEHHRLEPVGAPAAAPAPALAGTSG